MEKLEELKDKIETCWIIGGSSIYNEVLQKNLCDRIYLTIINEHFDCDTFFPIINNLKFSKVSDPIVSEAVQTEGKCTYEYHVYEKK